MAYCTNCGAKLKDEANFCTECGWRVSDHSGVVEKKREERTRRSSTKLYKGNAPKSTETEQIVERPKKTATRRITRAKKSSTIAEEHRQESKGLNIWVRVYLILNIILGFAPYSDEKMGLLMFSIFTLLIIIVRRKKETPVNVWVKIILGVQIFFTISLIGMGFEEDYWPVNMLYVAAMLFAEVMVIWKGNH